MSAEQKQKQMALQAAIQIASLSAPAPAPAALGRPSTASTASVISTAEKILAWLQEEKAPEAGTQATGLKEKMIAQQWDARFFAGYAERLNKVAQQVQKDSETPDPAADDCLKCSFCGTPKHDALYLFASTENEGLCICNSCVVLALNLYAGEISKERLEKLKSALHDSHEKAKYAQSIQDTLNIVSKWNVGPYQK